MQILLGHSKIENTVRYHGLDVYDALSLLRPLKSNPTIFARGSYKAVGEVPHSSHLIGFDAVAKADALIRCNP